MNVLIMNRDDTAARWEHGKLTVIQEHKLPLYLIYTQNVEHWLETRAIDHHRANSRLLKKALRLAEKDDISTVIRVNAATVTDTYWIKPVDSPLTYNDIRFDNDYFSNLALRGNYDSFNRGMNAKHGKTPELTNIGSFEKCWKLRDGEWWMYKRADHNEQFSELFTCELGKALGMNMAQYVRGDQCVKTKDFTNSASVNFEAAYSFMGDNDDYADTVKKLNELSPNLVPDYVNMIFLDTLVANPDRHTFNFGILRTPETGKIIGFAPNFDNNMALIARGYPKNVERKNDVLIKLFHEFLEHSYHFRSIIPVITEDMVASVLKKLNMKVKSKVIETFVWNGYKQIMRSVS